MTLEGYMKGSLKCHQAVWKMGEWSCYKATCVRITLEPSHHSWSTRWEQWVLWSGKIIWENDVIRNGSVRFRVGMTGCGVDFCVEFGSMWFSRLPFEPDHIYWIIWITIWDRKPDLACWTGIWIQNHNMVGIFVVRIWVGMHWFGSLSVISSDIRLASKEVIMMHPGSQWTGSQLAVTLQAVSGLVNCDVTCTAGLPTGTN